WGRMGRPGQLVPELRSLDEAGGVDGPSGLPDVDHVGGELRTLLVERLGDARIYNDVCDYEEREVQVRVATGEEGEDERQEGRDRDGDVQPEVQDDPAVGVEVVGPVLGQRQP